MSPSRTPASRPRRVAGHASRPAQRPDEKDVVEEHVPQVEPDAPDAPDAPDVPDVPGAPDAPDPLDAQPEEGRSGTVVRRLLAVIVVLVIVLVVEGVLLVGRDDPTEVSGAPLSAERPVQLSELTVRSVVDQAASAAVRILSASSAPGAYDEQVDEATATMTDAFAEEYRATKAEIEDEFLAAGTEVSVDVSAQGVVSATPAEVVALLFLTQTTAREGGAVTPVQYRVTVTMVDTPDGWLVSSLQAQ